MKIAFLRPNPSPDTIGLQHLMVVEPLELEILATLVRDDHEPVIIDMILEKDPLEQILSRIRPEVLCVTGYITHIPVMLACCRTARQLLPDIVTVVGGVHIEKFPEDIEDPCIDYRVVRNATRTFPQLIRFLANGEEFPAGVLRAGETLKEALLPEYDFYVPLPDRSLTQIYRPLYFYVYHDKVALVKTSFGCPFTCRFCYCREITGRKYAERPLGEVLEEIESIREKEVYIIDDDFLLDPKRVAEFISLLHSRHIEKRFLVYGRADFIASHPEILHDFKECGLRTVIVGLESFDDEELSGFHKTTNETINHQALSVLNRYGIDCYAAIIISPTWTKEDFARAYRIMRSLKIRFVNLQPLTPLKGIGMDIKESQVILNRKDYARWDLAHVSLQPEHMTVEEFYREIIRLYHKILFHPLNLLQHLKYPLRLQWRLMRGLVRVNRQYRDRIMELRKHV